MADLQMFFRGFVTWYIKPSFMTKEKIEQNLILKLSFDFALLIITFCEELDSEKSM